MGKTKKTSKHKIRGDGCSMLRIMASENSGGAPWSDLNHDVLFSVMMQLEIVDFVPFSGVCKSWRSLALSNKCKFMASRPPRPIWISIPAKKKEYRLEDSEGRKSIIILPQSAGRTCVGLTCGYLVLFGKKTHDFWLVNPVTRHGLHFPKFPWRYFDREAVRAILVFSPSISAWVFLVLFRFTDRIWFSIVGKGVRNYVDSYDRIRDLHDFKGKIYTIGIYCQLYELKLDLEPKLTLLKSKNFLELKHRLNPPLFIEFVCSGENLYLLECCSRDSYEVYELDFDEMNWVSPEEKTMEELAFFVSDLKHSAAFKPETELWSDSWSRYKRYAYGDTSGNHKFFTADMWYFPHDCLKVNLRHE